MAGQVLEVLAIPRNRGVYIFVPRATRLQGHVTKRKTGSGGENAEFTSGVCFIAEFLSVSPHSKDASCNL